MPFKSEAQRRLMWAKHPDIARKWADETGPQPNLPKHVAKVEHESHAYNWRSRENLKRGRKRG